MEHAKFVKLWESGLSANSIAEKLQISTNYVYKYAKAHRKECPKRHKSLEKSEVDDVIHEDSTKGASFEV